MLRPFDPKAVFNLCLHEGSGSDGSLLQGNTIHKVSFQIIATQHSGCMGQTDLVYRLPHASNLQGQTLPNVVDFQSDTGVRKTHSPKPVENSHDDCQPVGLERSPGCSPGAGDMVVRGSLTSHPLPGTQGNLVFLSTLDFSAARSHKLNPVRQ